MVIYSKEVQNVLDDIWLDAMLHNKSMKHYIAIRNGLEELDRNYINRQESQYPAWRHLNLYEKDFGNDHFGYSWDGENVVVEYHYNPLKRESVEHFSTLIQENIYGYNNATNTFINMKNKKIMRLTESDLHNIIKESVSQILNELNWKTKYNAGRKEQDLFDRFTQGERNFTDSERKRLKRRGKELGGLGYGQEYNKKSPFLDAAETDFEEQYGDKFQGEDGATYGVRADFFNKGDIYPYRDAPAEEWNEWGIDTETGDVKPLPMKGRYITGSKAFDFDKTGRLRKSYDKAKTEFNTLR